SLMRRLFAVAVAAASLAACTTNQRIHAESAVARTLVSDQQEAQLGQQTAAEIDKQGLRYVSDPAVVSYVQGLMNRLAPFAKKDRNINFDVKVIDDPKTVNAFAIPGGHMYVYSGLI